MSKWTPAAAKAARNHLQAGESVIISHFVQKAGMTKHLMATQIGGVVGAAIGVASAGDAEVAIDDSCGVAATLPKAPLHMAVTQERVLLFGHGMLLGKPSKLVGEINRDQVAGVVVGDDGKIAQSMTVFFADGSAKNYDSPRMRNNAATFMTELNR